MLMLRDNRHKPALSPAHQDVWSPPTTTTVRAQASCGCLLINVLWKENHLFKVATLPLLGAGEQYFPGKPRHTLTDGVEMGRGISTSRTLSISRFQSSMR